MIYQDEILTPFIDEEEPAEETPEKEEKEEEGGVELE